MPLNTLDFLRWEKLPIVTKKTTNFSGTFVHHSDVNYSKFLKAMDISLLNRAVERCINPIIAIDDEHRSQGFLIFHEKYGLFSNVARDIIYLGEPYIEVLPNGEYAKAITVQEGDNNLITRLKRANGNNIEIRYEFSDNGLKFIIRMVDSGLEATRFFCRQS